MLPILKSPSDTSLASYLGTITLHLSSSPIERFSVPLASRAAGRADSWLALLLPPQS